MKKSSIGIGALAGVLWTAALTAASYLGDRLAGLPFIPFDVLDWITRFVFLGPVITFGIDRMVDVLLLLNLSVAATAKIAEQAMAVGGLMLTGIAASIVFFAALGARAAFKLGLALGATLGLPVMLISARVNQTAAAPPLVNAVWILALFLGWGAALGWTYQGLARAEARTVVEEMSIQQISRRRFLVRVGTATAAITVVGAGLGAVLGSRREELPEGAGINRAGSGGISSTPRPTPTALPDYDADVAPAPGTRPEITPLDEHYRIDINARPPLIDVSTWTLPVTGLVARPLNLTLSDIRNNYEPMDQYVTLSCISNRIGGDLIGTTR